MFPLLLTIVLSLGLMVFACSIYQRYKGKTHVAASKLDFLEACHHLLLFGIAASILVFITELENLSGQSISAATWNCSAALFVAAIAARIIVAEFTLRDQLPPLEVSESQATGLGLMSEKALSSISETTQEILQELKEALRHQDQRLFNVRIASDQLQQLKPQTITPAALRIDAGQHQELVSILTKLSQGQQECKFAWEQAITSIKAYATNLHQTPKNPTLPPQPNPTFMLAFQDTIQQWQSYLQTCEHRDQKFQELLNSQAQTLAGQNNILSGIKANNETHYKTLNELVPELSHLVSQVGDFLDSGRISQSIPQASVSFHYDIPVPTIQPSEETPTPISESEVSPALPTLETSELPPVVVAGPIPYAVHFPPGIALIKEVWDSYRIFLNATNLLIAQINMLIATIKKTRRSRNEENSSATQQLSRDLRSLAKRLAVVKNSAQFERHHKSLDLILRRSWDPAFSSLRILRRPDCDMYLTSPSLIATRKSRVAQLWLSSSVPAHLSLSHLPLRHQFTLAVRCLLEMTQDAVVFFSDHAPYADENLDLLLKPGLQSFSDLVAAIESTVQASKQYQNEQQQLLQASFSKLKQAERQAYNPERQAS